MKSKHGTLSLLKTSVNTALLTSSQLFSFWLANVDIDGNIVPLKAISMPTKKK